ncbi:hypothetical protein Tco_1407837 [Tanacetum coccineum]
MARSGTDLKMAKLLASAAIYVKMGMLYMVTKKCMPKGPLQLVDEFVDESGPARPVVFREPNFGRFQLLLEVQKKGKEKVIEEQAAHDLLTLQTLKRKSPTEQFIFQRRTPMPTKPSGIADSPSLDADLAPTDSETESDEEVPGINAGDQDEGQARPNPGVQDEGQAGPNPGVQDEGQAGSNPEATDASTQQNTEQIDEEFTTTAYLNVQENLKLPTKDQVILEDPKSTTGTLSSLQNLDKELSFTNQFLEEKPHEDEPEKTNAESEVQSMVMVPIHQDTSSVPPMATSVIELILSHPVSTTVHAALPTSTVTTTSITTTSLSPPPPQPQQNSSDPILLQRIRELEQHIVDLIQSNLALEEWLDKHGTRLYNSENLNIPQKASKAVDDIVTDAPPPPPPPTGASGAPSTSGASRSSQLPLPPPPPSTGTTSDTRYESTSVSVAHESSPTYFLMNEDSIPKEQTIPSSNISDVENNWASTLVLTYEPPAENSLLAKIGDMTTFMNWYCSKVNKTVLTQADFKGQAYEVVKAFYPDVIHLQFQMEECHKMLTDQIIWTNLEGDQVRINARTVNFQKKAARYPDFGLELLVPEQMWIDKKFYIKRHDSPSRQREVKNHMRILSVVSIKAYSRYGYDYINEIVLCGADFQEYKIAKKDFKNLYPSDFEDLNLLLMQGHLDHLSSSDKRMLSTALNLTKPRWDAKGYEFKHDYTIIESPRVVVFPINHNERKIMRFNKIYKFCDGMLTRILEVLDYKVKEFKIKWLNPGMNTRFWTQKDVTRSKEFMSAIERRLKTRRIYQNLECFIGGRVCDIDYRLLLRTDSPELTPFYISK